ncbi:ATP-binding cassette sub-family G member 8 [Biomphalaria glabrata]|nr:ATP-binding cassette sub-family G member 8 [Biomphalaria glabrata]
MERQVSGNGCVDSLIDLMDPLVTDTVRIDVRVDKLSYSVPEKSASWWRTVSNLQNPVMLRFVAKRTMTRILSFKHLIKSTEFCTFKLKDALGSQGQRKQFTSLERHQFHRQKWTTDGNHGRIRTKSVLDSCAGYVRQDDRLIASLTVRETLMFVAQLKLPRTFSEEKIKERVDLVIAELGLTQAADTKVGNDSIRGLSGGERRRVSIGIQLLILPSVLVLDEPTSGLDSYTANSIVKTLSMLASKQRTVIMSIHQPRFDIFTTVDTMMLLSKGSIVFNGPAKEMVNYFTSLGYPCPEHMNPCDYYIDLTAVDNTSPEREHRSLALIQMLLEAYKSKQDDVMVVNLETQEVAEADEICLEQTSLDDQSVQRVLPSLEKQSAHPGIVTQCHVLLRRFLKIMLDEYKDMFIYAVEALLLSLHLGVVFYGLKRDQGSIRDWFGLMFMTSALYANKILLGLVEQCHQERRFIYFELQDKLYHPAALYFAKILSDIPCNAIMVTIYALPVYLMVGVSLDVYNGCLVSVSLDVYNGCLVSVSLYVYNGCLVRVSLDVYNGCLVSVSLDVYNGCLVSVSLDVYNGCLVSVSLDVYNGCLVSVSLYVYNGCLVRVSLDVYNGCLVSVSLYVYNGCLFMLFVGLPVLTSRCLAMMSSAILPTNQMAAALTLVIFSFYIQASGFFINLKNTSLATRWISQISFVRWGFQALCLLEVKPLEFQCDRGSSSCMKSGADALYMMGFEEEKLWHCCLGILGNMSVFLIVMFLGFLFISQKPHDRLGNS